MVPSGPAKSGLDGMSRYLRHDAASWVQHQLDATIKRKATKRDRELAGEGRGWYGAQRVLASDGSAPKLNEFHSKAFTILGLVANGIYNAPIAWHLTHWRKSHVIIVWQWGDGFGTFDFDKMSMLWMLCHMARIRGYISAPSGGRKMLEIFLSQRSHEGSMSQRHPSMEQALDAFFDWYPQEGPLTLNYPGDRPFPLPAIKQAIHTYHHALDTRQDGTLAAAHCVHAIEAALGQPWVQGATIKSAKPEKVDHG